MCTDASAASIWPNLTSHLTLDQTLRLHSSPLPSNMVGSDINLEFEANEKWDGLALDDSSPTPYDEEFALYSSQENKSVYSRFVSAACHDEFCR